MAVIQTERYEGVASLKPDHEPLHCTSTPRTTQKWFVGLSLSDKRMLSYLNHRYGATEESETVLYVTRYVEHHLMCHYFPTELKKVFDDVFRSLSVIHDRGYRHTGLEMNDILVTDNGVVICGHWEPSTDSDRKRVDINQAGYLMYSLLVRHPSWLVYTTKILSGSNEFVTAGCCSLDALDVIRRNLEL